jgi:hypothetical protein
LSSVSWPFFSSAAACDVFRLQVINGTLSILGSIVEHSDAKTVQRHLNLFITALTKRMQDTNVMVRKSIVQHVMSLVQVVPPADVIGIITSDNMSHRSWRVRQSTIDIVTTALLKHPSNDFDLPSICEVVTYALLDPKRAVRHAAMECVAVMFAGRQQALISVIDRLESETNSDGLVAAVQARLARRQLPVVRDGELIEYAPMAASSQGQGMADVDWIIRAGQPMVTSASYSSSEASEGDGVGYATPPTGRRYLSASKSLSKMPWERENTEVGFNQSLAGLNVLGRNSLLVLRFVRLL